MKLLVVGSASEISAMETIFSSGATPPDLRSEGDVCHPERRFFDPTLLEFH